MSRRATPAKRLPQKQVKNTNGNGRGKHPNTAAALAPTQFKPGESGNPGGNHKRSPKISNAYARILSMTPDELKKFKPVNVAEELALNQIKNAQTGKPAATLRAVREVTDRTEGRAPQRVMVDNTSELERLVIRVQERIFAQTGIEITRERAVELIVGYKPELGEAIE